MMPFACRAMRSLAVLLPLLMAACASGPSISSVAVPPVPPGAGRIWFYRDGTPLGLAMRPAILLNGAAVGDAVPNGAFYRDVPPGRYMVATGPNPQSAAEVTVGAGQEAFVRTSVVPGFFAGQVRPELVSPEEGRDAVSRRAYTGGKS